ncbi:MAG: ATP-binding protein [Luteolibacter sp.]|uniref:AAA family ATPase n=1 Tax=Luteolibacter sp. TaxID=1962973 RepID=UPI00326757C8
MKAIIISGAPATGKTHLGRYLAEEMRVPLLARDTIKETLFDSLGHSDRKWSVQLGSASYDLLFALAEEFFHSQIPCLVLEANFSERAGATLGELARKYGVETTQVFCTASADCQWKRFQERALSGERHPGHVDAENLDEAHHRIFSSNPQPLALPGLLVELDTTEISTIDYTKVVERIKFGDDSSLECSS